MNAPIDIVVLGTGFVGRAVERAVRQLDHIGTVSTLEPADDQRLANRTSEGAGVLHEHLGSGEATVFINCCGRLRGSDEELADANAAWPRWLAEVLADGPSRLVHLGSASEYGDPGGPDPIAETAPARPSGAYGETKWAGSSAVLDARAAGLDAVVVRGFNLVAANLADVSPLHQFRSDVEALPPEGGEVTLWYPPTTRDFILLDDLAAVVARLATLEDVPAVVNGCSGVGISFGSIVEALAAATGRSVTIASLDRPGIPAVVGDPTLMRRVTGVDAAMNPELLASTILGRAG